MHPQRGSLFTLVDVIEHAAAERPEHVAFRHLNDELDYATLDRYANRLACHLMAAGVVPGDRVALILPRCLESAVAVFGIVKAGACYVPLEASAPAARLAEVICQCDVRVALLQPTMTSLEPLLIEAGVPGSVRMMSDWWDVVRQADASGRCRVPSIPITPKDPAYIIHTSGTTGAPKGIVHTHASALRYIELSVEACALVPDDVIACHAPLHTDMSTLGLLCAPWLGATTIIVPEAHARVPESLAALMASSGMTVWYSVPLALVQLLDSGALSRHDLPFLRWIIYAGKTFAPSHVEALMCALPGVRISNQYGPAETNVCTVFNLPPDAARSGFLESDSAIPIGFPRGDNVVRLVDPQGGEVEPGETGELLVSSPTMMRGYWRRPDLDRKVFVETGDGRRFYRTGDLARYTPDHGLVLAGRLDRQVKVRGFRVELDDVERRLSACPGVREVAAFVEHKGPSDSLRIHVAVLCDDEGIMSSRIAEFAARHLTPAAVPEVLHFRADFPRTPSGKTDRRELARQVNQ